jgi:cyanophycinase-like exopeptidase
MDVGTARSPGLIALAGSGEFLPVMEPVDRALLQGRLPRAAFLPTAAALEGDDRVAYWLDLGGRHYRSMGVEPVPVPVRTRADADDPSMAALVEGVGLVYLSGGDPHHLSATLGDSLVWRAIVEAWHGGAAVAGCSAGAMALTAGAPTLRPSSVSGAEVVDGVANGLGLVDGLAVIPHFDFMERWRPGAVERFQAWQPAGTALVGIEENTAMVGDGSRWRVEGRGAVWLFEPGGRRRVGPGEAVPSVAVG